MPESFPYVGRDNSNLGAFRVSAIANGFGQAAVWTRYFLSITLKSEFSFAFQSKQFKEATEMTTMVNAIETDIPTTKLLQDPFRILPLLADSPNDDFAFYSMDKDGRFVYLSKSAEKVLRHDPKEWLGRSFRDALTAAPCNDRIRTTDPIDRNPTCCKLEIFDSDGKRLSLRCWSAPVLENGTFIGKTGLVQRFPEVDSCDLEGHKNDELQSRAGSLTSSEIQVVEMVFEGKLNKTIARELGVSMRTVEARRSKSMKKLGVSSFSELIQLWGKIKARNG